MGVSVHDPEARLHVYAFDGASYTGYNKTTNASGEATFTLPQGDYRFRADKDGEQYWSGPTNHCPVPGCTEVTITVGSQTMGTPAGGVASGYPLPDLGLLLLAPLAVAALGRRKRWQRWTWPLAGALLAVAVVSTSTALAAGDGAEVQESEPVLVREPALSVSTELDQALAGSEMEGGHLAPAPVPMTEPSSDHPSASLPAPAAQSGGTITTTRVITYTYDPLGRLVEADYSTGESFAYQYDAVGNRTAMTDATGAHTYTYDEANRLTSVDGVPYTWDDRGNLVSDGTFTYAYNAAGRMARAESVTSTLVYTYSAQGLRVAQSVDGDVTSFAWDWASGLPEMLSEGGSLYLVGHETLGQWDGDAWDYYLPDALGSVRQVADGASAVTDVREWTPYGMEVGGSTDAGLGYAGEYWDADVGLQYLRARWYDVYLNQFVSPDTIVPDYRNPQSINRYTYALGNPIRYTDPTGLVPYIPPELPNHRDLTYWLYDEIHANANGYYAQRISTLLASDNPGDNARAVLAWIFLVKDNAKWDPKHRIEEELGRSIVLRHANGYRWYEYSVPGNINYSFVGRAAGFSGLALHGGAGFAEIIDPAHAEAGESCCPYYCRYGWAGPIPYAACIQLGCYYVNPAWWSTLFDDPTDWQNVAFGVQMFDAYGSGLTFEQFQDFLAIHGESLTPAPSTPEWFWINPLGGWPYETGRFDGPEAGQNDRWVRNLLRVQQS